MRAEGCAGAAALDSPAAGRRNRDKPAPVRAHQNGRIFLEGEEGRALAEYLVAAVPPDECGTALAAEGGNWTFSRTGLISPYRDIQSICRLGSRFDKPSEK